eukprot:4575347-Prymnesium_polylepis.1
MIALIATAREGHAVAAQPAAREGHAARAAPLRRASRQPRAHRPRDLPPQDGPGARPHRDGGAALP